MSTPQTLIIDLADLPSLTALAVQPDVEQLVLWHPGAAGEAEARRAALVQRHAEMFSAVDVVLSEPVAGGGGDEPQWYAHSVLLLQAMVAAERTGCTRIIWPHQLGPAFEVVGSVVEHVATLAALPSMGGRREPIPIDLPLVDLTDEQVVELADDSGASLRAFWPCDGGGPAPCGRCDGCRRWADAFEQVGVAWPWEDRTTVIRTRESEVSSV